VAVKDQADCPPNSADLPMTTNANAAIDDRGVRLSCETDGGTGVSGTSLSGR